MVNFRYDVGPAVHIVFIDLNFVSSTTMVKATILLMPRLDGWTASVVDLLCINES